MGLGDFLRRKKPPEDYYADRVKATYTLEVIRYPEIFTSLHNAIEQAREDYPYPHECKLGVLFTSQGTLIRGEFLYAPESARFDYIGRLIQNPQQWGGLALQTFSPPEDTPQNAKPSLDLVEALCPYIVAPK